MGRCASVPLRFAVFCTWFRCTNRLCADGERKKENRSRRCSCCRRCHPLTMTALHVYARAVEREGLTRRNKSYSCGGREVGGGDVMFARSDRVVVCARALVRHFWPFGWGGEGNQKPQRRRRTPRGRRAAPHCHNSGRCAVERDYCFPTERHPTPFYTDRNSRLSDSTGVRATPSHHSNVTRSAEPHLRITFTYGVRPIRGE